MANICVVALGHPKRFDIINLALLFWPGSRIFEKRTKECSVFIRSKVLTSDKKQICLASVRYEGRRYTCQMRYSDGDPSEQLRIIKLTLFNACRKATGICPPWGILTGIRPMSVYEKLEHNMPNSAFKILTEEYLVSRQKAEILRQIYRFRTPVYYEGVKKDCSLYISIPFCPSKCLYCSFVSSAVERVKKLIEPYVCALLQEIKDKIEIIYRHNFKISTIYIGGGTPGILSAEQIDRLLSLIFSSLKAPLTEFCFEIGRPETVTEDKLAVLRKYPVTRLCINTQTMNDTVLAAANRRHTAAAFARSVALAREYGFDNINVDLIAGLPEETVESHISSLKQIIAMGVENITVHSLSIKKASTWVSQDVLYDPKADRVVQMLQKGQKLLFKNDYKPYYIYRQKSTLSNGENIGYAKEGTIGRYNIYMMEDVHSVFGCGAGASTKIINLQTAHIERFVNTKYPQEYLSFPEKLSEQLAAIDRHLKGISE